MGSGESQFNVLLTVKGKVTDKTAPTNHNLFEEEGERKRNRAEAALIKRLTARPNRLTGPIQSLTNSVQVHAETLYTTGVL